MESGRPFEQIPPSQAESRSVTGFSGNNGPVTTDGEVVAPETQDGWSGWGLDEGADTGTGHAAQTFLPGQAPAAEPSVTDPAAEAAARAVYGAVADATGTALPILYAAGADLAARTDPVAPADPSSLPALPEIPNGDAVAAAINGPTWPAFGPPDLSGVPDPADAPTAVSAPPPAEPEPTYLVQGPVEAAGPVGAAPNQAGFPAYSPNGFRPLNGTHLNGHGPNGSGPGGAGPNGPEVIAANGSAPDGAAVNGQAPGPYGANGVGPAPDRLGAVNGQHPRVNGVGPVVDGTRPTPDGAGVDEPTIDGIDPAGPVVDRGEEVGPASYGPASEAYAPAAYLTAPAGYGTPVPVTERYTPPVVEVPPWAVPAKDPLETTGARRHDWAGERTSPAMDGPDDGTPVNAPAGLGRRTTVVMRYLLGLLTLEHFRRVTRWAWLAPVIGLVLLLVHPRWIGIAVVVLGVLMIVVRQLASGLIHRAALPRRFRPVEPELLGAVEAGKTNLRVELRNAGLPNKSWKLAFFAVRLTRRSNRADLRDRLRQIDVDKVLPRAQLERALRLLDDAVPPREPAERP
jgi:hypothetical protein